LKQSLLKIISKTLPCFDFVLETEFCQEGISGNPTEVLRGSLIGHTVVSRLVLKQPREKTYPAMAWGPV
jgi:hypothetical protein